MSGVQDWRRTRRATDTVFPARKPCIPGTGKWTTWQRRRPSPVRFPPGPRIPKPFQTIAFLVKNHAMFAALDRRYGSDVVRVNLPRNNHAVVITDPVLAKDLFTTGTDLLERPPSGPALSAMHSGRRRHSALLAKNTSNAANCSLPRSTASVCAAMTASSKKRRSARSRPGRRAGSSKCWRRCCGSPAARSCAPCSAPRSELGRASRHGPGPGHVWFIFGGVAAGVAA